ncbi:MAG: DUF2786 domain-containing protein [Bradyrhizobium sp.]|nr:DUF2786 domain-containing protein [Bradyrhizobium sp.]
METVKLLLARTVPNGCTESEAKAAQDKARELMAAHRISAAEVRLSTKAQLAAASDKKMSGDLHIHVIRELLPDSTYVFNVLVYGAGYGRISIPAPDEDSAKAIADGFSALINTHVFLVVQRW